MSQDILQLTITKTAIRKVENFPQTQKQNPKRKGKKGWGQGSSLGAERAGRGRVISMLENLFLLLSLVSTWVAFSWPKVHILSESQEAWTHLCWRQVSCWEKRWKLPGNLSPLSSLLTLENPRPSSQLSFQSIFISWVTPFHAMDLIISMYKWPPQSRLTCSVKSRH